MCLFTSINCLTLLYFDLFCKRTFVTEFVEQVVDEKFNPNLALNKLSKYLSEFLSSQRTNDLLKHF